MRILNNHLCPNDFFKTSIPDSLGNKYMEKIDGISIIVLLLEGTSLGHVKYFPTSYMRFGPYTILWIVEIYSYPNNSLSQIQT